MLDLVMAPHVVTDVALLTEFRSLTETSGKRFEPIGERLLEPALRSLAIRLPRASLGVTVVAEMPGPVGVPDLVAIPAPGDALDKRLRSTIPPQLSLGNVDILANLSTKRRTT